MPLLVLFPTLLGAAPLHYRMEARVDPAAGTLRVVCRVDHWPKDAGLFLHQAFRVEQFRSGGRTLPCRFLQGQPARPFCPESRPLSVEGWKGGSFEITYTGKLDRFVNDVNIISPALVELAGYASWYPMAATPEATPFTYDLRVTLPGDYTVVTNGQRQDVSAKRAPGRGLRSTRWTAPTPTTDIALVAAPGFHPVVREEGTLKVEAYHTALPEADLQAQLEDLVQGYRQFRTICGEPPAGGTFRTVYAPREGWGYSRLPLTVVSEAVTKRDLAQGEKGRQEAFHGSIHEVAHFWWRIAPAQGAEDWINEGLAEFSAFRASAGRFGEGRRRALLDMYLADAARASARLAILDTTPDSRDRYVNFYEKTSLLLAVLEARHGAPAMDAFLKDVFQAFKGTERATTPAVVALATRSFGPESGAWLRDGLAAKPFPLEAIRRELGPAKP